MRVARYISTQYTYLPNLFSYLMGLQLGIEIFIHNRIISAVKSIEFVSDRMSYITLKGRCCDIIVLNVHAPTEDKDDDIKDSLYEELE
jgi:predicted choloylglycine hydrolase